MTNLTFIDSKNLLIDYSTFYCIFELVRIYKKKYGGDLFVLLKEIRTELENNFYKVEETLKYDLNNYNSSHEPKDLIQKSCKPILSFYLTSTIKFWNKYYSDMSENLINLQEIKDYLISYNEIKDLWDNFKNKINLIDYNDIDHYSAVHPLYPIEMILNIYAVNNK